MTHRQIEASREARLWISQVIVPTVGIVCTAMAIPEVRAKAVTTANKVKTSIKNKGKIKNLSINKEDF